MPHKVFITLAGLALLSVILYSLFWFYLAEQIKHEIHNVIAESPQQQIYITPDILKIRNYPFTPEVYFSGQIRAKSYTIQIPVLLAKSFFLPGKRLQIKTLQGLSFLAPADSELWSLDHMEIDTVIPRHIPTTLTYENMNAWQAAGNQITISNIILMKKKLTLHGQGIFKLDHAVQPEGFLNTHVTGHMDFLQWLQQHHYIKPKEFFLSATALASLSKADPDTGDLTMDTAITLQNQILSIGGLPLITLPALTPRYSSTPP